MKNMNFDDYMDKMKIKLDANPELSEKIEMHKDELSKIFEIDIDITLNFDEDIESYRELFDTYEESVLEPDEQIMTLKEFIQMLNDEDDNLKLSFDPIHLKDGINNINNVLVTTYEDNVIIVPIVKKDL